MLASQKDAWFAQNAFGTILIFHVFQFSLDRDVSKAQQMQDMFKSAVSFNGDISQWMTLSLSDSKDDYGIALQSMFRKASVSF